MMILALFTALCGAVLAFRFRVVAVLPAIALIWTIVVFGGVATGSSGWTIVFSLAITAASLQIGYFAGACARVALLAARVRALRSNDASEQARRA